MATQNFQNISASGSLTASVVTCDELITNTANLISTDWIVGTLFTNSIRNASGTIISVASSQTVSLDSNVLNLNTGNIQLANLNTVFNTGGNVYFSENTSSNVNFNILGPSTANATLLGSYIQRNGAISIGKATVTSGYSLDCQNGITTSAVLQTTRTENPTTSTNGALRVSGGIGVQKDIYCGANINCGNITLRNGGISGNLSLGGNLITTGNIFLTQGDGLIFPNKCSLTYGGDGENGLIIDTGNIPGSVLGANIIVGNIAGNTNPYINFKIQGPAFQSLNDTYPIGCVVDYNGRLLIGTETALSFYTLQNAGNTRTQCLTTFSGSDVNGIGQPSLECLGGATISKRLNVGNYIETGNLIVRGNNPSGYNGNIFTGNIILTQQLLSTGNINTTANIIATRNIITTGNVNTGNINITNNINCGANIFNNDNVNSYANFYNLSYLQFYPRGEMASVAYCSVNNTASTTLLIATGGVVPFVNTNNGFFARGVSFASGAYMFVDGVPLKDNSTRMFLLTLTLYIRSAVTLTNSYFTLQQADNTSFTTPTNGQAYYLKSAYVAGETLQVTFTGYILPDATATKRYLRVLYTGSASLPVNTNGPTNYNAISSYSYRDIIY